MKIAISAKAAKLLREVQAHILEEPRSFDLEKYLELAEKDDPSGPPCGTVACIAGWVVMLGDKSFVPDSLLQTYASIPLRAQKLLGIGEMQSLKLFLGVNWPREFRVQYGFAIGKPAEAAVAVRRIDHFIRTGE
jgi:hypothetical protein